MSYKFRVARIVFHCNKFSVILKKKAQYKEAISLYEEALKAIESLYGPDHIQVR